MLLVEWKRFDPPLTPHAGFDTPHPPGEDLTHMVVKITCGHFDGWRSHIDNKIDAFDGKSPNCSSKTSDFLSVMARVLQGSSGGNRTCIVRATDDHIW